MTASVGLVTQPTPAIDGRDNAHTDGRPAARTNDRIELSAALPMIDDTATNTTEEQTTNNLTDHLLDPDEEISLRLDDGAEIRVSIVRSLHLPDSVRDGIDGGSLRHTVRTTEQAAEHLDLPSREGLISAEEPDVGSWNRPRIGFYDLVTKTDDDGNAYDDYGDLQRTHEITDINSG